MKRFLLSIFLVLPGISEAQSLDVKEIMYDFGSGAVPAHQYSIPHVNQEEAIEKVSREIKKNNGKIVKAKGNKLEATGVQFKDMGSDVVDIKAHFEEQEDGTVMTCAFIRDGVYMNSESDANDMKKINASAIAITSGMAVSAIGLKVALAEKELKSTERDRDRIKSEIERMKSENDRLRKQIEDNEGAISKSEKELEEMDKKVQDRGEKVKEQQEKQKILK